MYDWIGNMRKNAILIPILALCAGAAGFYLRLSEVRNVFDETTGLARRGALVTCTLISLCAATILLCIIFSVILGAKYKPPHGFENAFGAANAAYTVTFSVLGLLWLAAAAKYFLNIRSAGAVPVIEIYFAVFSALSALSIILLAIWAYKYPSSGAKLLFCAIPPLFMCFWLILLYKRNAANPVILSYGYQCLAIIAAALGFYFTAGFAFGKPSHGKAVFSYLAAIFFCSITLADKIPLETKAVFAIIISISAINSIMLIRNLEKKQQNL